MRISYYFSNYNLSSLHTCSNGPPIVHKKLSTGKNELLFLKIPCSGSSSLVSSDKTRYAVFNSSSITQKVKYWKE